MYNKIMYANKTLKTDYANKLTDGAKCIDTKLQSKYSNKKVVIFMRSISK